MVDCRFDRDCVNAGSVKCRLCLNMVRNFRHYVYSDCTEMQP